MTTSCVELLERETGAFVAVDLHRELKVADVVLAERSWSSKRADLMAALLKENVPRAQWPQSLHWDWRAKAPDLKLLEARGFGIHAESGSQGLMLTKNTRHVTRLKDDAGKPLVYVDFLETAPWNWSSEPLKVRGRFGRIGSLLFREAVLHSRDEGFHGRVDLHALPQSEAFYEGHFGLTRIGPDASKQGLVYLEFTRKQAEQFLKEGGG